MPSNHWWSRRWAHLSPRSIAHRLSVRQFIWDDFQGYFNVPGTTLPNAKRDDVLTEENRRFLDIVGGWRRDIFDDGVHCTAAFFKP